MAVMGMLLGVYSGVVEATSIVEVRTAAPNVIVVVLETDFVNMPENGAPPVAPNLSNWQVNGAAPSSINRYSIPWDELPTLWGNPNHYPVKTRHRIYLNLGSPLVEGHTNTITTPYGNTNWTFSATNSFCESIKVNQVGYSKLNTSRFANFGVFRGDGGTMTVSPLTYKVYNENTGAILTNGTAVDMGDDTGPGAKHSGEHVYRLSLNAIPEGGPYYVSVDGAGRSRSFGIGDNYSSNITYVTMRGMYLHRCGIALTEPYTAFTHAICHTNIYDTRSAAGQDNVVVDTARNARMFVQGGYHDAGDMDHTEGHPLISILMLSFFEAFTNRFVDHQYDIPESTNGIPDFLDEIMWGVKLWEYLQVTNNTQDPDYGGVRSGWSTLNTTTYGSEDAANDARLYGTKNVQAPCTAEVAGVFAQASRLIRPYDPVHANSLSNEAQLAWNYLSRNSLIDTRHTCYMYAALQLYLLTGSSTYHDTFKSAATNTVVNPSNPWPETYWPGNGDPVCRTAHFVSYLLPQAQSIDATLAQNLKSKILSFAETGTYMGPPPENLPYPQGVTNVLQWGTGTEQGMYADVWMYGCLFTNNSATLQRYTNAVAQYADFSLGLNPMNMSYYTGLGTDQPNSPLDCNSYYTKYGVYDGVPLPDGTHDYHTNAAGLPIGNVPGICVYGPFDDRDTWYYALAISTNMYPGWGDLPQQRRYGHGHSMPKNNEFTVPQTMVWNVPMYAFLYTPTAGTPPPPPPLATAQRASGAMTIDGNLSEAAWSITNTVSKTLVGTNNNTVTFGALWDDTYLYVGAKVLDANLTDDSAPSPWQDDAIEIYIDGDHNHGTSYDSHDRQIVKGWSYPGVWANGNQTNGILHAWSLVTGGYSVELAIPWTNFGISPSSGTLIGFDVANDDDDNGGLRESQVVWAGTANNWTDTSGFGDLKLQGTNGPPPGEEFTNDANTIALYHFTGSYSDSSANGFNLTSSGNVTLTSNPGWMQNPSGSAARFSDLGDQLIISTIPDSLVEPGPSSPTPLSIEARIFVRGYKAWNRANARIISLYEDWDARFEIYDPIYPASGQPIGPTVAGYQNDIITTASQWQNAVSLNAWHKFKLTFAADGTANCYIDGNLVSSLVTSMYVPRSSAWTITLGNFDGDIDELRISNIVR